MHFWVHSTHYPRAESSSSWFLNPPCDEEPWPVFASTTLVPVSLRRSNHWPVLNSQGTGRRLPYLPNRGPLPRTSLPWPPSSADASLPVWARLRSSQWVPTSPELRASFLGSPPTLDATSNLTSCIQSTATAVAYKPVTASVVSIAKPTFPPIEYLILLGIFFTTRIRLPSKLGGRSEVAIQRSQEGRIGEVTGPTAIERHPSYSSSISGKELHRASGCFRSSPQQWGA